MPDAVKEEFVNVGVVLLEAGDGARFADARFTTDWRRLRCLYPAAETEVLDGIFQEVQKRVSSANGDRAEILRTMQESFSNGVQLSPPRAVLTQDPARELEELARQYLKSAPWRPVRETGARQRIFTRMRDSFKQAGVWDLMRHAIPVAQYTRSGDPLKIDCGYSPNGLVRMFHALSLESDVDSSKVLAFTYQHLAAGIQREENRASELTAIVESNLNPADERIAFGLEVLKAYRIATATTDDLARLAQRARDELRA
jgi:hypothetical protein